MANNSAPPAMQPFIARTKSRLQALEEDAVTLRKELARHPIPDKAVFVDGPAYNATPSITGAYMPPGASVRHNNTTGLVEVTVSATIRAANFGGAGVGVYYDELAPTIINNAPKYGVFNRSEVNNGSEATAGASFTTVFPVRPGTRTFSLFYYANNPDARTYAVIDLATLIVRSI